ncbi:MAG: hypothetical protein BGO01_06200 [Armatimonadetes bacterium 55-13]|nr:GerMN domain-containing protein [Armatimonadota bacterium]OJU61653.1 MAG: hypothetical protein BGO01_06200 [Armatimonadetes bacterium 55-13]
MASRRKKKSSNGPIIGLLAVAAIGLAGLAGYVRFGGAAQVPDEQKSPAQRHVKPKSDKGEIRESKVTLISPSREGDDLKLHKSEGTLPEGENAMVYSVNHFLKESQIVPEDAKVVGVQVKDRVALMDVTPSFNQTYGAFDEQTLIQGICASLAQFKEIDKVQFFCEGKVVETLGNVDLTEPISIRENQESSTPPAN